jgi:hypothetical protein
VWAPELFSASALERVQRHYELEELDAVPYYAGLMTGERDALIQSFAGVPILHDPLRGRIIGVPAFTAYVDRLVAWLTERDMRFEPIAHASSGPRGFEEVVMHVSGPQRRVDIPVAIVAERNADGRLVELRLYHSIWPLTGRHVHRPPLLQHDPQLRLDGVVAAHLDTLAAAGITLERCSLIDDGDACALEYNILGWGAEELPPEAGVMVFASGAVRTYDDADWPERSHSTVARRPSA